MFTNAQPQDEEKTENAKICQYLTILFGEMIKTKNRKQFLSFF